jgi:hypothetical protein
MGKAPYLYKSEAVLVRGSPIHACDVVHSVIAAWLPYLVQVIIHQLILETATEDEMKLIQFPKQGMNTTCDALSSNLEADSLAWIEAEWKLWSCNIIVKKIL